MSKLARKPIDTSQVESTFEANVLTIKGKHGELSLPIKNDIQLTVDSNQIVVAANQNNMLGLYCALIRNMVSGVLNQFTESLVLKGVGYRVTLSNNELNFNLGYSHPV